MQRYRAAVIGCGRIGSTFSQEAGASGVYSHAQAYRENSRTELCGLSDIDAKRLEDAGRLWGVETDREAVALCRRLRPDIVSICTPDETHFKMARTLLAETPPKTLFIEKPLALSALESRELLQMAEKAKCAIAVNYSRRYSPAFQKIKAEIKAGAHGRPLLARFVYGKGLRHNGSHAIDLLRYWFGDPETISGHPSAWGPGSDKTWDAEMNFKDGFRACLQGFDDRVATIFEMDMWNEKSAWRFSQGGERWEFFEKKAHPLLSGYTIYAPTERGISDTDFKMPMSYCLREAVQDLVRHLDTHAPLLCNGHEGLAAMEWVDRLENSL